MIAVIDYGLGNVQAFLNIYKQLSIPACAVGNIKELSCATRLILPGVGHFGYAMNSFNRSGLRGKVEELVLQNNVPILGVCVGMQMMANYSEEGGDGLGWVPGAVKSLSSNIKLKDYSVPHMGWNNITFSSKCGLFKDIDVGELNFYFLHSYYFDCDVVDNCIATTSYGDSFCSVINMGNIFGVQFHPEKSHHYGVNLLKNFSEV